MMMLLMAGDVDADVDGSLASSVLFGCTRSYVMQIKRKNYDLNRTSDEARHPSPSEPAEICSQYR